MKHILLRCLAGLAWLIAFITIGAVIFGLCFAVLPHHPRAGKLAAGAGATLGLGLFILAISFAALPGARRARTEPQTFGLLQGIWGMAAFALMLAAGAILPISLVVLEQFILIAQNSTNRINFNSPSIIITIVLAGELLSALWLAWYTRRLGRQILRENLAWRPAPPQAYLIAAAGALAITAIAALMFHLIPPNHKALAALPDAQLLQGSIASNIAILAVFFLLGPFVEELVFRGIAFGGIAARLGPAWAGSITTLLFTAVHFPEKIYYPPGFLDVALLAAAAALLRLRFNSIRPGILMHMLYNTGAVLAAAYFS